MVTIPSKPGCSVISHQRRGCLRRTPLRPIRHSVDTAPSRGGVDGFCEWGWGASVSLNPGFSAAC